MRKLLLASGVIYELQEIITDSEQIWQHLPVECVGLARQNKQHKKNLKIYESKIYEQTNRNRVRFKYCNYILYICSSIHENNVHECDPRSL